MLRKGQKVVCVWDGWDRAWNPHIMTFPKKNSIYTVRGFSPKMPTDRTSASHAYIWLEEIQNPSPHPELEPSFAAACFRPLVERKNDGEAFVAQLKKIALPAEPEKVPASNCGND